MSPLPIDLSNLGDNSEEVSAAPVATNRRAMVDHALAYARRGLPVFPCDPTPGQLCKRPLVKEGFKAATTDPAQIRCWWKRWPDAMIGLPMGPATGMLALDPDAPEDGKPDGVAAWKALEARHGALPPTRCHLTPGGGMHFIFAYPADREIGSSTGGLGGKGIHVRGKGGYVIAPPSSWADGGSYRLARPAYEWTLAEAPEWLLDVITGSRQAAPQALGALPAHLATAAPSGIVLSEADLPKPTPKAVAGVCSTFQRMVQDAPTAGEMVWWKTCELAMHTTTGAKLAHGLASLHPTYDYSETQARIDRHAKGGFGPPTCGTLQGLYGEASPCPKCPNFGDPNTSPVAIARREARRTVTAEDGTARLKPTVQVEGGEIASMADAAAAALLAVGVPIYQRSGKLMQPVRDEVPASHGRTTIVARLAEIKVPALIDLLSREVIFQRWSARDKRQVRVDPPRAVAEVILAREGSQPFPPVAGCVTAPTLRADGSLLEAAGYDPASRLYHLRAPGLVLPTMPEAPSRADAEAALAVLIGLLAGFPFAGPLDHAVALSGLMTPVLRGGMSAAPLHLIRAHTPGTGKSFLVDLAAILATGRHCPVSSVGAAPEELEKRLTALLLAGSPLVSLDNVNGEVGGDVLCQAVERPLVSLRPLGVSETREVECRATVFCTGNNATVRGDMVRRTVTCNLDAAMERPELRRFTFDPLARVQADRGLYIAAVLTIARFGRAAAAAAVCSPLGSFEDWTAAVRTPLVLLGMGDPAASMDAARAEDPELVAIRELFGHWEVAPGLKPGEFYRAGQIETASLPSVGQLQGEGGFHSFLLRHFGTAGAVSTIKLGKFLRQIHGRVVDGYRLEMRSDKSHGHLFALARLPKA